MTQQIININALQTEGAQAGFYKCNLNFTELYKGLAAAAPLGNAIEYLFNINTSEPPSSGEIRFDQAQATATKLWASHTTASGVNIKQFLSAATIGSRLIIQDKNDNTNYVKFDVTADPTDKDTYWEFGVAVTASGGNLPNGGRILVAITAAVIVSGGGGGGTGEGTVGPPGPQGPQGDPGAAGATGSPGPKGDQGDTGPQGPTGATGAQGSPGTAGIQGPPGVVSATAPLNYNSGTQNISIDLSAYVSPPQGRLTLQTGTPVMTTTQSAKTTIYYTPYAGNQIPLGDGVSAFTMTTFNELSVATTDTTKSPAAVGASQVLDWFVWLDGSTLRLSHGPAWTNDTTRSPGTQLTRVAGIWCNNQNITNGPAAGRGTYVGTTRSNASSQLDWIYGAVAANGTAGFFGVWNCYNRRPVSSFAGDNTNSWTYAGAAWRQANNSATIRTSFVVGLVEDGIFAQYNGLSFSDGSFRAIVGVGVNSTTAFSGSTSFNVLTTALAVVATFAGNPLLGFNFVSAIENGEGGGTGYMGDNNNINLQSGINFIGWF